MLHLVIPDGRHPSTAHFGPLFDFDHLPTALQAVSEPFAVCAQAMIDRCPDGPELSAGLRKLVEAKDCAVRSVIAAAPVVHVRDLATTAVSQSGAGGQNVVLQPPAQALGYEPAPGLYARIPSGNVPDSE